MWEGEGQYQEMDEKEQQQKKKEKGRELCHPRRRHHHSGLRLSWANRQMSCFRCSHWLPPLHPALPAERRSLLPRAHQQCLAVQFALLGVQRVRVLVQVWG